MIEFLLRLALGISIGLLFTSSRRVPAGFFRVHLWVTLGIYTLCALMGAGEGVADPGWIRVGCVTAGVSCYVAAVCWLYEWKRVGTALLVGVALLGTGLIWSAHRSELGPMWALADAISASLLLGFTMTAMLLGHWYLNAPGMQLGPLRRLVAATAVSVAVRGVVSGLGLTAAIRHGQPMSLAFGSLLGLRWVAGLMGIAGLTWMAWETLKIPNTQSATGILYVAVIFSFLGELTSELISSGLPYPL